MKHFFIFLTLCCGAAALASCGKTDSIVIPKKQLVSVYEYGSKTEGFASCTRETYSYDNKGRVTVVAYDDGKTQSYAAYTYGNGSITVTVRPSKDSPLVTRADRYTLGASGFISTLERTNESSTTVIEYIYDADGHLAGIKDGMKVTWENGEITSDGWNTFTVSDVPFHGFVPYNAIPYVVSDDALYRQGFFGKVSAHLPAGLTPGLSLSQEQRTFTYSLEGDRVHAVKETIHTRDIIGQEKTAYSYSRVTWVE